MEFKTRFNKWDETFIIVHWDIFSFFITGINIEDDEKWVTINYSGKIEMPFGKVTSKFIDWKMPEEDIYSTLKSAKKELEKAEQEDEADKKEILSWIDSMIKEFLNIK